MAISGAVSVLSGLHKVYSGLNYLMNWLVFCQWIARATLSSHLIRDIAEIWWGRRKVTVVAKFALKSSIVHRQGYLTTEAPMNKGLLSKRMRKEQPQGCKWGPESEHRQVKHQPVITKACKVRDGWSSGCAWLVCQAVLEHAALSLINKWVELKLESLLAETRWWGQHHKETHLDIMYLGQFIRTTTTAKTSNGNMLFLIDLIQWGSDGVKAWPFFSAMKVWGFNPVWRPLLILLNLNNFMTTP